jgi:hypothetical protein
MPTDPAEIVPLPVEGAADDALPQGAPSEGALPTAPTVPPDDEEQDQ